MPRSSPSRSTSDPAAGLRLESLVVDERQIGSRLGYDRHQRSPALLRGIMRRLHGRSTVVPWSRVAGWSRDEVRLR